MALNIVLVQPDIPQNTGNIARTCAVTGARLHLVKPLGFEIDNKHVRRAGLDYWDELDISVYENLEDFFEKNRDSTFYFFTTKGKRNYCDVKYIDRDFLVFGRETKGLDEKLIKKNYKNAIRIPMKENIRSLNLSNCVAIAVYEAYRQLDFIDLLQEGKLTFE
ncbi:MAG: tRNA (uridine(34)/cytosine(34)/5-carboxymethylaminomethyluridine(34)-2'-O)-methyltransferase TrmL [Clostridiales bacterium]|nr:tRNA (uridine(34)/cytosine(34)/5-carboxymethylaminomethyluridine(34)-2'-O)-methyltransferase TrmL [Clostridiales bacterium]